MTQGFTITRAVHFRHGRGRRKVLERGKAPAATVEPLSETIESQEATAQS